MNKIIHTGHAGFILYFGKIKIVCDHWSSSFKPFSNSWKKLETDIFSDKVKYDILNPDYLIISNSDFKRRFIIVLTLSGLHNSMQSYQTNSMFYLKQGRDNVYDNVLLLVLYHSS